MVAPQGGARLVLALGNPGRRHMDTRHNIGWWLADRLARRWGGRRFRKDGLTAWCAPGGRPGVEIHKPLAFMNRSGDVLPRLLASRGLDPERDMLVLVDDIALPPGRMRIRGRGSPGGHNGLASVSAALGSDSYCRLRLGVGRPADARADLAAWVLAPMSAADEEAALAAFPRAEEAVERWLDRGVQAAMNHANASPAERTATGSADR